ncbi:hypothetical protein [Bdellovibrio reynosensis]|uniref:DUF4428 domain-containing protein n=1 Tax=Bdellovibrio reynosensis TaxID=2835041 RepID=A0ABY4C939_9BACT|nr:hypothetical protein [Bdellovibrio reynosensis]UOF01506.1 hypothetical protein MNR06_00880 [Bdellovibrio reynosensis]
MVTCQLCLKKTHLTPEDLVCSECEKRFAREAAFGESFFEQRKYFKSHRELKYQEESLSIEVHSNLGKAGLLYYATGLILKTHLESQNEEETLLGAAFERIAKDYCEHLLEDQNYQFIAIKREEPYPAPASRTRIQNLNAVSVDAFDFSIILITDKNRLSAESPFYKLVSNPELIVLIENDPQENVLKKAAIYGRI